MTDIKKTSMKYVKQQLYLAVAVALVVLLVMRVWYVDGLLAPLVVGVAFSLLVGLATGMIWHRVAMSAPDNLPTFFTAASGARLLLALATMFVYYLVAGRESMLTFFLVFMAFYAAALAHHAIFFARVSNRN